MVLPEFLGGDLPAPESRGRKAWIRTVAIFTFVLSVGYVTWRVLFTVDLGVFYVAIPLLVAEAHNCLGFLLFTLALWDRDVRPKLRVVYHTRHPVAMLIPTYNEPLDVLLPTVAAAVALEPKHETWVLDDGRREWVRVMAEGLGAKYLTRPDNAHAKAGNLNHALGIIKAEFVGVLDADHVPMPNFLRHTLGYFDDPTIAVVQTPQDFYNHTSFEHQQEAGKPPFSEEAIFYRVIAPAKNSWGAAFWCGTSAVVRVAALRAVGGVATETVTEDIHTTMKMNRLGWKAVYHNEVLARGLAPSDARQYLIQRHRWAMGAMQVLKTENPLTSPGFTFGQRLSFATTLLAWFDAWRTLIFMVLAPAVLLTGASPIQAPGIVYGPLFLAVFVMQFVSLRMLARGQYPPLLSLLFETLRLPASIPATLSLFRGGSTKFVVTPKGRSGNDRARMQAPHLLWALLCVNLVGLMWFGLTLAGWSPMHYAELAPVWGASAFAAMNAGLLLAAIMRVQSLKYGTERREGERFSVSLPGRFNGGICHVTNVSMTGAAITLPFVVTMEGSQPCTLSIGLPNGEVTFTGSVHPKPWLGPTAAGVEFDPGQYAAAAELARALLWPRRRTKVARAAAAA